MNQEPPTNPKWELLAKTAGFKASELAVLCGVSLRTLQRHFSKNYQVKISDWLRGIRLRQAYKQLQAGFSVKEVAIDLGYKQLSHFSRDFKSFYGVRPSYLTHGGTAVQADIQPGIKAVVFTGQEAAQAVNA